MRLTTKGKFAVIAMIDLSSQHSGTPVTLSDIGERQGISISYLEQLFAKLKKNRLVIGTRGPGGGYRLSKPPKEISIMDIIDAVEDSVDARSCGGEKNCGKNGAKCLAHEIWVGTTDIVRGHLSKIKLDNVARQQKIILT